jgi:hypothetical protein
MARDRRLDAAERRVERAEEARRAARPEAAGEAFAEGKRFSVWALRALQRLAEEVGWTPEEEPPPEPPEPPPAPAPVVGDLCTTVHTPPSAPASSPPSTASEPTAELQEEKPGPAARLLSRGKRLLGGAEDLRPTAAEIKEGERLEAEERAKWEDYTWGDNRWWRPWP